MIGLILGTSEGKEILEKLNRFTENIFVTTATNYGGELLQAYKYKHLNSSPLSKEALKAKLLEYKVTMLVDASHPYALEITENTKAICREINISYIRYERPSIVENYLNSPNVRLMDSLEQIKEFIESNNIEGTILNTTGSKSVDKFMNLGLSNRIIYRVLPTKDSIEKCLNSGVKVEDIVAIKGPIGFELNKAFIKEYEAKAMVLKDSGAAGGTEEKLRAAIEEDIWAFVLNRKISNEEVLAFSDVKKLIEYVNKVFSKHEND
jgi:precorrin-6A/cobalt-precorrin-6A reductase